MSDIGIVRRMDDLGRMVIPKEIRRNLKIREGDPLEIFIDKNSIIFRKYNPIPDPLSYQAENIAKSLTEALDAGVLVARENAVIAAPGNKPLLKKTVSGAIMDKIQNGESIFGRAGQELLEGWESPSDFVCTPVIHDGSFAGAVILLKDNPTNVEERVMLAMTDFLKKQY
ncbi:MAG: stage V sporulation T C-terminal domain-containing protein [Bacillota bacterium]